MKEVRANAKKLLQGYCRVCPICNGKACAGEVPGMGGVGTGASFIANVASLAALRFNMRCIHDASEPDTRSTLLDIPLELPVLAAPIGGISFNMGGGVSEEDYVKAVLQGCKESGVIGCVGDGVPPVIHESGLSAIKALSGHGIPFIKPWEDEELFAKLDKATASGALVVGMDIDAAGLITLKLMGRPVSPKPVHKLREIIARTPMRFIIKGVMTPGQAKMAVEAGAAGIVVSNHGGRVLDHTPGVAEVVARVAAAVRGQCAILADGGVRTGADVLKMLALGADAVLIGRPLAVAAMGGLKDGVVKYLAQIKTELKQAMVLTGTRSVKNVDPAILYDN